MPTGIDLMGAAGQSTMENELPAEAAASSSLETSVFVLMPYGSNAEYEGGNDESNYVFEEIITPGVKAAVGSRRIGISREVDKNVGGSISASIVRNLVMSDIVIVDITGRNPNVFLELGMRYALRSKITILLAQEGTAIPFDVKGYRHIEYNKYRPAQARTRIADAIREGLKDRHHSDSVVFDIFKSLSVNIPGIAASYGEEVGKNLSVLSWDEYMDRITFICEFLKPTVTEATFVPDALIGITNGGMIAADLIGRRVFAGTRTPVLSLWARRFTAQRQTKYWFFENAYNNALMEAIHDKALEDHPSKLPNILLVDDHMGTGQTAMQAINYLREKLGEGTTVVYVPVVSRRLRYIPVVESYLPYECKDDKGKRVFRVEKNDFINFLNTTATHFPYRDKEIHLGTSGD
jgi:hypoxanthine phosphoribosyltransferase